VPNNTNIETETKEPPRLHAKAKTECPLLTVADIETRPPGEFFNSLG
jgi:hypothetical protein